MQIIKENCNICASNQEFIKLFAHHDNTYFVDRKKFEVIKCTKCGVATVRNKPTPKQLKKYYEYNYYSYDTSASFFFRLKHKWINIASKISNDRIVNKLLFGLLLMRTREPDAKVLDVGCGDGTALSALGQMGFRHLYGSEIDPIICQKLRKKGINSFCAVDITKVKLKDQYFDLIRMSHVLEHVYNPEGTITFLRKKLSPSGSLMIAVPNFGSVSARLFGKYFCGLQLPTHLYHFDKKNLKQLLHDEGFVIIKLKTTGFSGISYSLITLLKDRFELNKIPNFAVMLLVAGFLPLEILLNLIGQGFMINVHAAKSNSK